MKKPKFNPFITHRTPEQKIKFYKNRKEFYEVWKMKMYQLEKIRHEYMEAML